MTDAERRLINKIKALADSGVGGEKINAEKKLQALMKKFNLTLEDLESEQESWFKYKMPKKDSVYYKLTVQVMANYKKELLYTNKRSIFWLKLTPEENIELQARLDFYLNAFKKEEDNFLSAFIYTNDLEVARDPDEVEPELTEEDLERIADIKRKMRSLDKHNYMKQLTGGN